MANLITSCGTNSIATGLPQGSHMIADGTNYWIFYGSSTQSGKFCYRYSSDTITWSTEATVTTGTGYFPSDARLFTIIFNPNNLCLLVVWYDTGGSFIRFMRGVISEPAATISWGSLSIANGSSSMDYLIGGLNSSSVPFVIFNSLGTANLYSYFAINPLTSSFADTYPGNSWGSTSFTSSYTSPKVPIAFHLDSNKIMAVVIDNTGPNIDAFYSIYTPTSWSTPTFIAGGSSLTASAIQWGASYISPTNIALVGVVNTSTFAFYIYDGSAFNNHTAPGWPINGLASNFSVMLSNDSVNYNLFIIDGSGYLETNSWNGSSWSGWSILNGDTADTSRNYIQEGTYAASATDILYTHTNGSNYEIWITKYSPSISISISQSFIESADLKVNYYNYSYSHNLSPSGSLMSEGRGSDFLVNPIFKSPTPLSLSFIEHTDFLINPVIYKFVPSFFQPTSISGCFAWYPSTSVGLGNIPSGTVTYWQDLSGSGNDLHSISPATNPEYYSNRINGYPSVIFNSGASNSLKTTLFPNYSVITSNKNLTVFTVFKTNDPIGRQILHSIDATFDSGPVFGLGGAYLTYNNASGWFYSYNGPANFGVDANMVYTSGLNLDTEWYIRADGFNSAGNFFMRRNGTTIFSRSDPISNSDGVYLNVGFSNKEAGYFNGEIAEIIYYNRSLNSGELTSVEQYLAQKYNIPGNNTFPLFLFADNSYTYSTIPLFSYGINNLASIISFIGSTDLNINFYKIIQGIYFNLLENSDLLISYLDKKINFIDFYERADFLSNPIFNKPSSPFFQPVSISGCFGWYPSTSIGLGNIPSGAVTYWRDLSGSGNNLIPLASSNVPYYYSNQLNGYPTVRFNGSNSYLTTSGLISISNQNFTSFIVFNTNTPSNSQSIFTFDDSSSTNNQIQFGLSSSSFIYTYNKNSNQIISNDIHTDNEYYIRSDGYDINNDFFIRRNGTTISNPISANSNSNDPLYVGTSKAFNNYLNGNIAEIILYNRQLNSGEVTSIEQYLAQKYNIPGNNTFPLFLFGGTSSGIYSNISLYEYNIAANPASIPLFVYNQMCLNNIPLFLSNTTFVNPTGFDISFLFPLYIQTQPVGTGTNYNYIPLTVGNYVQLATANPPRVKMFISGEGTLVGGSIESSTMPLFLERQAVEGNSFPLYIQSNLTSSGIPLTLQSANIMPGTGVLLYISGLGASGGFPCYLAGTQFLGSGIDMFVEGLPTLTSNIPTYTHGF